MTTRIEAAAKASQREAHTRDYRDMATAALAAADAVLIADLEQQSIAADNADAMIEYATGYAAGLRAAIATLKGTE